jgi:apolipoprotein D and lipocalin family protein
MKARISRRRGLSWAAFLSAVLIGTAGATEVTPLRPVGKRVDLNRFMGDWYVIASIPIDLFFASEVGAHNAVESYELRDDGKIQTTYTFRKGGFDGAPKQFNPVAWVHNAATNSEWRMQFLWPFRSAYLIAYLDDDYQYTIIGVPNRKNVWVMSRTPEVSEARYAELLSVLTELGYDTGLVQRLPQQWSK